MAREIRPYRAEDRAATTRIFFRAVREGTAALLTEAQRAAWAPRETPDLTKPDKLLAQWCWVAWEGDQPTGFLSLCPDGLLDMAFVLPEVMGKGTAAALYDTLLAKARAEGLPRLTVVASPYSHRFLAKRGWQTDREGPEEHDGQSFYLYRMSLSLDAE